MIIKTDFDLIQNYLSDSSNLKSEKCDAVFLPESVDGISQIIKEANQRKIAVTISGAGTGLTGGRVPIYGGYIISLEKLNKIISLDIADNKCIVQAGVTLTQIDEILKPHNLFYPPDPTERNCSIGGTIATNASGARSFKYGSTRNWVEAIKVILPDGEICEIERGKVFAKDFLLTFQNKNEKYYRIIIPDIKLPNVKNASGYFVQKDMDLIDLFIGSEGTLGLIVEATIKLVNTPKDLISAVIFFENFNDAYEFVSKSRDALNDVSSLIKPRALEFFDDKALGLLSSKFPIAKGKKFAIWYEQEIYDEDVSKILDKLSDLITKCNGNIDNIWYALDMKDLNEIHNFRHSISVMVNEYIAQKNLRKVGTDTAVLPEFFKKFYTYCRNACISNSIEFVGYGHIGNDHLHLNMLPENENSLQVALNLYKTFCELAVKYGGTVSAEHGIGKLKRKYFELMYSKDDIHKMFSIKKSLDPNLILNRGNIFSDELYGI